MDLTEDRVISNNYDNCIYTVFYLLIFEKCNLLGIRKRLHDHVVFKIGSVGFVKLHVNVQFDNVTMI